MDELAGVYFHIPFCKQACHYCNFHFSTSLRHRDVMTEALLKELDLRRDYLPEGRVASIYFGGGTPSLLPVKDIARLIQAVHHIYTVLPDAEITLEANPDDMTPEWLEDLKNYTPVNRLSIGIQSFSDVDLQWMHRAHNARHALKCLENALQKGFEDLSIDLIYGAPVTSDEQWAENLHIAFDHGIPHLSCYCLTVEEGTALHHFVRKGKAEPVDEERAARQFEYLMDRSAAAGYEHYEISNFAFPGRYAKHNSSYWQGQPYLGLGPSAHSYNGYSRQWNAANNALYLKGAEEGQIPFEKEMLTQVQGFNEYVMTMLRTQWGCDLERLRALYPSGAVQLEEKAAAFLAKGEVVREGDTLRLTPQGRLLADRIAMTFFCDEP